MCLATSMPFLKYEKRKKKDKLENKINQDCIMLRGIVLVIFLRLLLFTSNR